MIRIQIETDNAAFESAGRAHELARILRIAADRVEYHGGLDDLPFKLRDINGNTVGQVEEIKQN